MAEDYFIIEHEGHIAPHSEFETLKEFRDWGRFMYSADFTQRFTGNDHLAEKFGHEAAFIDGKGLPEPEASIAIMDAAGIDMLILVPHWHAVWMNVEPKGTPIDWVIEVCERFPDRLLPGPVFRPSIVGVKETLREMEYLVTKKGVKFCKIYPPGEMWDMNDHQYWPVYSLAQELGLVVAFHTGHGYIYGGNTHASMPRHLDEVCRNFYDLKILAFHMGWPWHHDLNCLAGIYPNLYIGLSFLQQAVTARPHWFGKLLGEAIECATVDKVIWSNDAIHWVKMHVDGFRNYQFSQFLQEGYGYKALTTEDKAKMFGLNMANLLGIEPKKITKTPPKT